MFKYLRKLWKVITAVRTGLANIIFICLIVLIAFAIFGSGKPGLPDEAPLLITISGVLVDKETYEPTFFDLIDGQQQKAETLVRDVVFAINEAANDERVTALVLNLNYLRSGSLSKLEEIGQAIEAFKKQEKPVIAYADNYSQQQYFLASYADEIYLNSMGNVSLTGFGIYQSYFKEAADKLSLKFHLFKAGNFKDAAEPYVRNSMSEASREHKSELIDELWQRYTGQIESRRDLPEGTVSSFIEGFEEALAQAENDFALATKNAGFVDHLVSRVELNQRLIEKFGQAENSEFFKAIYYGQYLSSKKPTMPQQKNNIGLIVGTGTIVDGEGVNGQIGGNSFSSLIREAINDDSLAALIIRIDSGGGSAFASELIRDEIENAKANNLPVYVSMGSVAASGGYWVASAADEIWALPSTITGSIGVWGLVPNVSESFKKLGIHNDGYGTTSLADIYQFDRPLSPQAKQVFQSGVDSVYSHFIDLVSTAREKPPEDVHDIAQGRVWTGKKALEFGLVDELGSLDDLVNAVGEKLELDKYQLKVIEHPMSPSEQFMRALLEEAKVAGSHIQRAALGENVAEFVKQLQRPELDKALRHSTQGMNYFAECLSCIAP